jgi:hypothetical protein
MKSFTGSVFALPREEFMWKFTSRNTGINFSESLKKYSPLKSKDHFPDSLHIPTSDSSHWSKEKFRKQEIVVMKVTR